MLESDSRSLVAGVAGFGLILLLTLPSLHGIVSHLRAPKSRPELYADKDGIATKESMARYSAKIPKILLSIFTISGLCMSVALAALGTLDQETFMFKENWINAAGWVSTRDEQIFEC
jgi:hypothetical protein